MARKSIFSAKDFSEKKYKNAKQYCNAYERYLRARNPNKHRAKSEKFLKAILSNNKKPVKKTRPARKQQKTVKPAPVAT